MRIYFLNVFWVWSEIYPISFQKSYSFISQPLNTAVAFFILYFLFFQVHESTPPSGTPPSPIKIHGHATSPLNSGRQTPAADSWFGMDIWTTEGGSFFVQFVYFQLFSKMEPTWSWFFQMDWLTRRNYHGQMKRLQNLIVQAICTHTGFKLLTYSFVWFQI